MRLTLPVELTALFASLVEEASARFLALDPNAHELLAPLAGKRIAVRVQPPDVAVLVAPTASALTLLPLCAESADATLIGSPLAFARLALQGRPQRSLFAGEVSLTGDVHVARHFQTLIQRLDIDWQALLARVTGPALARLLFDGLRETHAWRVEWVEGLRQDLREYLQEESRQLPALSEGERFFRAVDILRADTDRLEVRIARLEQRLAGLSKQSSDLAHGDKGSA